MRKRRLRSAWCLMPSSTNSAHGSGCLVDVKPQRAFRINSFCAKGTRLSPSSTPAAGAQVHVEDFAAMGNERILRRSSVPHVGVF